MPHESFDPTAPHPRQSDFSFEVGTRLNNPDGSVSNGRTGVITTPHGQIKTPAFIAVGTKATVKAVLPESVAQLGAQAVLANAYHLYLQPGSDILDAAGGLGKFMNWSGPTFTDSGGFQVMSLGSGFKKVIDMKSVDQSGPDDAVAPGKERLANVDDDGVWFKSHIDGTKHRFSPEISMRVQHEIGADIMFAFDELTTLQNSRGYQVESLERTRLWAERCVAEHFNLTDDRVGKEYQALFGVIQGAQYEDLRRKACQDLGAMAFDGFGIGGALEKENLGTIVGWCAAGTAGKQAAPPAGDLRTRRHLHGHRERRRHLRLRLPHPGGPQLRVLHPARPLQPLGRPVQAGLHPAVRGLRLLHLRALHARLHPPPVQVQGDGQPHADLHPQRTLRGEDGRRRPPGHRERHLPRDQGTGHARYYAGEPDPQGLAAVAV